jgi:hypothetical protein
MSYRRNDRNQTPWELCDKCINFDAAVTNEHPKCLKFIRRIIRELQDDTDSDSDNYNDSNNSESEMESDIEWLEQGLVCSKGGNQCHPESRHVVLTEAASHGHLECLIRAYNKLVDDHGINGVLSPSVPIFSEGNKTVSEIIERAIYLSVGNNSKSCLMFILGLGYENKKDGILYGQMPIRAGRLDVLKLLINHYDLKPPSLQSYTFDAIKNSHINIVKWLYQFGYGFKEFDVSWALNASNTPNIQILKFIYQNTDCKYWKPHIQAMREKNQAGLDAVYYSLHEKEKRIMDRKIKENFLLSLPEARYSIKNMLCEKFEVHHGVIYDITSKLMLTR